MKPSTNDILAFCALHREWIEGHTNVVCLSGGMDSTAMLALIRELNLSRDLLFTVGFDYGQRHKVEIEYAAKVASHYGCAFDVIALPVLQSGAISGSPLVDSKTEVPAQSDRQQISTVVPYRNMLFAVNAAIRGYVASGDPSRPVNVWMGAVKDDFTAYRDCRASFFKRLNAAFSAGARHEIESALVLTPFVHNTKKHIVQFCRGLGVPWELTHTCYKGVHPGCGECDACRERADAFSSNQIEDPLFS